MTVIRCPQCNSVDVSGIHPGTPDDRQSRFKCHSCHLVDFAPRFAVSNTATAWPVTEYAGPSVNQTPATLKAPRATSDIPPTIKELLSDPQVIAVTLTVQGDRVHSIHFEKPTND